THRGQTFIRQRFPRIYETCLRYGVDIGRHAAPVAPAAHYAMGGVWTDLDGRTTIPRLFAAGEAACTGVHGANRLASNSLLEGLVFGARAAQAMRKELREARDTHAAMTEAVSPQREFPVDELKKLMWSKAGVVRNGTGLE